jgi:hypothetical protein
MVLHKHVVHCAATGAAIVVCPGLWARLTCFRGKELGQLDGQVFLGVLMITHMIDLLMTSISLGHVMLKNFFIPFVLMPSLFFVLFSRSCYHELTVVVPSKSSHRRLLTLRLELFFMLAASFMKYDICYTAARFSCPV